MLENYLPRDLVSIVNRYADYMIIGISNNRVENVNINKVIKLFSNDTNFINVSKFNPNPNPKILNLSHNENIVSTSPNKIYTLTETIDYTKYKTTEYDHKYTLYYNDICMCEIDLYKHHRVICGDKYIILYNKMERSTINKLFEVDVYDHKFRYVHNLKANTVLGFIDDDRILINVKNNVYIYNITTMDIIDIKCKLQKEEFKTNTECIRAYTENNVIFTFPITMIIIVFGCNGYEIIKLFKEYSYITVI